MTKWLLAALASLATLVVVGAAWLLGTQSGLQFALRQVESATGGKLEVRDARGALAHEIQASRIAYSDASLSFEASSLRLRLALVDLLAGRVTISAVRAGSVTLTTHGESSQEPVPPFAVRVREADVGRLQLGQYEADSLRLRDVLLGSRGAIRGNADFAVAHLRWPIQVALRVSGTREQIRVDASLSIAGVPVSAKALLAPRAAAPLQSVEAQAGPIDLQKLDAAWPRTALHITLSGKPAARSALAGTLSGRNAQPGPVDRRQIPVSSVHTRFSTDWRRLALDDLKVVLQGDGTLSGGGEVSETRARLKLGAHALDLRVFGSKLRHTRLEGPLTFLAEGKQQSLQGTLSEGTLQIAASIVRSGDELDVRSMRAQAEGSIVTGSGRLRLAGALPFEARLELAHFDPSRFGDYPSAFIDARLRASGTARPWRISTGTLEARLGQARLEASGGFGGPQDRLAWRIDAPRIADLHARYSGQAHAQGELYGAWENPQGKLSMHAADVRLPNGLLIASLTASASGTLSKHDALVSAQAEGLDLEARLRGGWQHGGDWSGELYGLRNSGRFPMQLVAPAALRLAARRIELGRLEATLGEGRLLVKQLRWSPGSFSSSGAFQRLPAQWLVLAGGLAGHVSASLLLDGEWSLDATPRLAGSASFRRASGDLSIGDEKPVELGLTQTALQARFTDGAVQASAKLESRFGTLQASGRIVPAAGAAGLGIDARSAIDARVHVAFAELGGLTRTVLADTSLAGQLRAELRLTGTLGAPRANGTVSGESIAFQAPAYGVYLKNGTLAAVLEGDRLRIDRFAIDGDEGRLSMSGALQLDTSGAAAEAVTRLNWQAERFSVVERPELRLVASGSGVARLDGRRFSLSGSLRSDRGSIELGQDSLPRLGEDVVVVGRTNAQPREQLKGIPLDLDLRLDLADNVDVTGYGLEGRLGGKLDLKTTKEGQLRAYGRIHTVHATFLAYGQRLQVDPGVAIFDGPLDNPALQMTAWRRNQQVEAGVQVTGNARAPRVQLVSQPPVPENERLSWLVLGRGPSEVTRADLGLLQAAAGALLSRGEQMPLDQRVARTFGLDEISLRGGNEVAQQVVAFGKRLSDRLYVSYEQGLGVAASSLVKLDLALTRRFSVRAQTGTSSGLGLFYRFSWD